MLFDVRNLLLALAGSAGIAWAATGDADPESSTPAAVPATAAAAHAASAPSRFRCRIFPTSLDRAIDTRDRSSELGRWVIDQESRGWQVASVDFEVGQKPTGFSEGYVQVCLTPVLG